MSNTSCDRCGQEVLGTFHICPKADSSDATIRGGPPMSATHEALKMAFEKSVDAATAVAMLASFERAEKSAAPRKRIGAEKSSTATGSAITSPSHAPGE